MIETETKTREEMILIKRRSRDEYLNYKSYVCKLLDACFNKGSVPIDVAVEGDTIVIKMRNII